MKNAGHERAAAALVDFHGNIHRYVLNCAMGFPGNGFFHIVLAASISFALCRGIFNPLLFFALRRNSGLIEFF